MLLNEELTPQINSKWMPGGEVMQLVVDDDYTFRLRFAVPYPIIIDYLPGSGFSTPKHYLKQFHISYNADAVDVAEFHRVADALGVSAPTDVLIASEDGRTRAWLYELGAVIDEHLAEDGRVAMRLRADPVLIERLERRAGWWTASGG